MKTIKSILLAITMLLAAPAFLTSCQEDAPEINYTMNVSVINDFSKVVEAINNGSLKNEEAIRKLTEAIDRMNTDQQTKLQAVIDVINSVNATLETKLTAIEAAMKAQTLEIAGKLTLLETAVKNQTLKTDEMGRHIATAIDNSRDELAKKLEAITDMIENNASTLSEQIEALEGAVSAQTLSLETKLGLIEDAIRKLPDYTAQLEAIKTAISSLPDYGEKLSAIEAAIKALPDYSEKFDAIVAALDTMKTQAEALGTAQAGIATQIAGVTTAINNLIAAVNSGNTNAADALTKIIQKLEELKEAIANNGGTTPPTPTPNGDYVDLGLPSGLKWAKRNLGATKPSSYGNYYAWGETEPKIIYLWETYKWRTEGGENELGIKKYTIPDGNTQGSWYDRNGTFIGDNKSFLAPEDDAATDNLDSPWRMPTPDDFKELCDNCTWTWTSQDGKRGYEVKGSNGNSIFLPCGGRRINNGNDALEDFGYYMTSELYTNPQHLSSSQFYVFIEGWGASGNKPLYILAQSMRFIGVSVRPVHP